jgi:hypothetical protein
MPGFGRVPLNDVWAMLKACAPGLKATERTHNWCLYFGDRTYPSFPKGEHGKTNPEIEVGHIKRMARFFGILECAKKHIEALK